mmetsp:Transcript_34845/g.76164  ORF Transcript_34845/g.76164 Transcript_34845/m.76164 type:complete len:255 (-) Transcript_34845:1594-2358(-)
MRQKPSFVTAPGDRYSGPPKRKVPRAFNNDNPSLLLPRVAPGPRGVASFSSVHLDSFDWELPPPVDAPYGFVRYRPTGFVAPEVRVKRSKENTNRQLQSNWDLIEDKLFGNRLRYLGRAHEREEAVGTVEQQLSREITERLHLVTLSCPRCASTIITAQSDVAKLLVIDVTAHCHVDWPSCLCNACSHRWSPDPMDVGTFPATPSQPQVVYTDRLLQLTTCVKFEGHISLHAWAHALSVFHEKQHGGEFYGVHL